MRYLLDTNILSDLMRRPAGRSAHRLMAIQGGDVSTSIIVVSEIRYGVAKKGSHSLATRAEAVLGTIGILPFTSPADRFYAEIRAYLEKLGKPISANDILIAAHALATDSVLVTDNDREFSRIPHLRVENWLR